jgi:Bacterial Ig-like domain (group 2)/CARDB
MTQRALRLTEWGLAAVVATLAAACGGGNGNDAVTTPTRPVATQTVTVTATLPQGSPVPSPTPTVTESPPIPSPTTTPSGSVSGLLVVQRSVASNAGDALAPAPERAATAADKASFDRALSHADWSVAGLDEQHGVTSDDGRFQISGLPPGHYTLQVSKTLDGNLASAAVPFTVGDSGAAGVTAEVSWGQVRSTSTYTSGGAAMREISGPNGTRLVTRDGQVVGIGDPSRTLFDPDGTGQFLPQLCVEQLWSCQIGESCSDGRICSCAASCPLCADCGAAVCVPPLQAPPYRCDAGGKCAQPGDRCVCVPSCPECDDCGLSVCVPPCDPVAISKVTVTSAPSQLVVGQQGQAYASALLSDGTTIDVTYLATWQSSDESVATVDSWGNVSALAGGSTALTATLGSVTSDPWPVQVVARPPLRKIDIQNVSCFYPLGLPVAEFGSPVLDPPASSDLLPVPGCRQVVQIGGTIQFRAIGEFDNGYYEDITDEVQWQATPPEVGDVVAGLFTGRQAGTTQIAAALGDVVSDATEVRVVTEPTVVGLSIYADNGGFPVILGRPVGPDGAPLVCLDCSYGLTVLRGDTLKFHATAQYDTGEWRDVTAEVAWHSSDAAAASIDASGAMTAVEAGDTEITATLSEITSNSVGVHVVNQATLESLSISEDGNNRVVAKGDQRFFHATGSYDVGFSRDVTKEAVWHSSDESVGGFDSPGVFTGRAAGTVQVWAELDGQKSNMPSLEVFEASELSYCDPTHINRSVWADDFNRVTLESDCADYNQPGVAGLRYTVTETQPHGGIFDPCLDLYVFQGNKRVRTIREEGCGDPFLPLASPGRDQEALKYQLKAFWDLKDDGGAPVPAGTYTIYGRFYLYYDPVVSINVTVHSASNNTGELADLVPTRVLLDAPPPSSGCVPSYSDIPPPHIDVCIKNQGDGPAGPFLVSVQGGGQVDEFRVGGLAAGEEKCISRPPIFFGVDVVADSTGLVPESDETNNRQSFSVPVLTPPPLCTQTAGEVPTPTPSPPVEGACYRGSSPCGGEPLQLTSQAACCQFSQLQESVLPVTWCPADQFDPTSGQCAACSDPCKGLAPTPTPTPACTELPAPQLTVSIAVDPPNPRVGDDVQISVSPRNTNGAIAGLPQYTLLGASPYFEGETIQEIRGPLADVTFALHAVQAGTATLQVRVSFEAASGCSEQPIYYFTTAQSEAFTVTVES